MANATSRDRFLSLLKNDVLKLDLAELDFGIYRILAHRRAEIERFFDETLPALIAQALAGGVADRVRQLNERLAALRDDLTTATQALGLAGAFDAEGRVVAALEALPKAQEYTRLAEERARAEADSGFADTEEAQIFAHLYTFGSSSLVQWR